MRRVKVTSLQTYHMYSTLKRCGNGRFYIVSKWNTLGVFVRMCLFFFYIFMTYNLQRKIKFTITRYIKNIYTWEKNRNKKKIKKRIKSAINDKKILKN